MKLFIRVNNLNLVRWGSFIHSTYKNRNIDKKIFKKNSPLVSLISKNDVNGLPSETNP